MHGRKMGTTVMNPTVRGGQSRYTECTYCHKLYTHLGIGRHWGKCPENPKNKREVPKDVSR